MSLAPFLVVTLGAGALSLLLRHERAISSGIGFAGLVLALALATRIGADEPLRVADASVGGSDFLRLFLVLGATSGLLCSLLALATTWSGPLPGAWLIVLGASGLAIGLSSAVYGVAAATVGALAGILVTIGPTITDSSLGVARREFRALIVGGVLAVAAAAVASGAPAIGLDPAIIGLTYLGFVAGVAIRLGSIPFHLWVARAADSAPPVGLPLVMAWAPAAFVLIALSWTAGTIAPLGEPLSIERALVVLVAAVTIVLAAVAASVNPDLEHVVGYSIVADGALGLLGLASLSVEAWEPTRTWLLAFVLAKTAFAAWVAAIHFSFGARQLDELRGWARKSPLLGLALAGIVVAGVGVPGMAVFDARTRLVGMALAQPLAGVLFVLSLVSLVYYGRLAVIGLRGSSAAVAAGPDPMPRWPVRSTDASRDVPAEIVRGLRANRAPIAAGLALAMAGLAVVVAGGGFGVKAAAAAAQPGPTVGVDDGETQGGGSAAP